MTAQRAKTAAILYSSGGITSGMLTKVGHPFAVRAPNSAFNPAVINDQGGLFRQSWTVLPVGVTSAAITARVVNTDKAAVFMLGTSKMVARPIWLLVQGAVRAGNAGRVRRAVEDSFYRP